MYPFLALFWFSLSFPYLLLMASTLPTKILLEASSDLLFYYKIKTSLYPLSVIMKSQFTKAKGIPWIATLC